ncbi:putative leucine-rich repeat-containing protein DDB_G0290503 [Saccostrea cucullata]|uniref:putative leucine-rich repeat-containing protein DDB_G0290503 n=1 Tax=Saccostrea cuccullata TaxID=36930 RepID=UPI002ED1530C
MRVMTNLCGKGRIYYAEKDISDMEVEMTLIENRSSNPMAKCKEIEEEIKEIETRLAPIEEKINELKYEVEDDEEFGMPIQESDKTQQGNMEKLHEKNPKGKESCLSGMAEMKNSLPASNEERYNMSGFSNEVVAFTDEEDKQEDKQENYQKEYTNETTEKIVLKKKDPEKVKWSGSFPGNLWNEGCGDNTVTDKDSDPKQQKNPGRLEILESKIKELKEEIRQLGEDIHSVTGVGILHNTEKKIKQLNQDVTLLGSMIKGNMNNLEERIKNFEERVNQLQENINTQRENQRKIFDSVDIQKNCESDSL